MIHRVLALMLVLATVAVGGGYMASARVYAVCVGINNYLSPSATPLRFAQSDATSFARLLYNGASTDVYTVLGRNATRSKVIETFTKVAAKAGPDDTLVFYFSGHGLAGGMCVYDTQTPATLLTYRDLSNIFKSSRARTKMIFADTCHSGSGRIEKKRGQGSASDFKKQNVILFLSSRANEVSAENYGSRSGLFTHYLLQGLGGLADKNRDRAISAREIFNYVSKHVSSATGNRQHPVMWGKFNPDLILLKY